MKSIPRRIRAAVVRLSIVAVVVQLACAPVGAADAAFEVEGGYPWVHLRAAGLDRGAAVQSLSAVAADDPRSLASGDFDGDGVADLLVGFARGSAGSLALYRGNPDSIYPNSDEARARKIDGSFSPEPFLDARTFDVPEAPDFLGAGDFDRDGHEDAIAAADGGRSLALLLGDGRGGFGRIESLELPGAVTALAVGEIDRADGVADLAVGVRTPQGPVLAIFQAEGGVLAATPRLLPLAAEAKALAMGQLDDRFPRDLAVAAGDEVLIVRGRDERDDAAAGLSATPPRLEAWPLDGPVLSVAIGDFAGDARSDLAAMTADGAVSVREARAGAARTRADAGGGTVDATILGKMRAAFFPTRAFLVRARVSSLPKDDLLAVDPDGRQVRILHQLHLGEALPASWAAPASQETVALRVSDEPVAVLPMRLNADAMSDLVLLRRGGDPVVLAVTVPLRTFTVDSGADDPDKDTNDGVCRTAAFQCTLRAAIEQAEASPGADEIDFAVTRVTTQDELPRNYQPITIDGTTSGGLVWIDDSGGVSGIDIWGGSSLVRGLAVTGAVDPGGMSGNCGISIDENGGNVVEGNYVGVTPGGVAAPNFCGVSIDDSSDNLVGGTLPQARNVLSGNRSPGMEIVGASLRNRVEGNRIGTDLSGTRPLGNSVANLVISATESTVTLYPSDNTVTGNVIAASAAEPYAPDSGIGVSINDSWGNLIEQNLIGAPNAESPQLGNKSYGVTIVGYGNTIQRNTIALNGKDGVAIVGVGSVQNRISENSVFANGGLGINLSTDGPPLDAVTANDAGDTDTGPNQLQNFPVLSHADDGTIGGALQSRPNSRYKIEFFRNQACDPSRHGEGEEFVASMTVTTNGAGAVDFTAPFTAEPGQVITATATDDLGSTSEFAACAAGGIELTPRLIIGIGFCGGDPQDLKLVDVDTGADITKDPGVTYEWIGSSLPSSVATAMIEKLQEESGVTVPIGVINVKDGKVEFVSQGVNVIRAKRGNLKSNYAVTIGGIDIAKAGSIDVEPVSAANLPVEGVTALLNKAFGTEYGTNTPMMLFPTDSLCDGRVSSVGTTGLISVKTIKFNFFGGLIEDVDLISGVQTLIGALPAGKHPLAWLAQKLAVKGTPLIASQFLDYEVSSKAAGSSEGDTEDSVISVSNSFPSGVVRAKAPGLSAVEATLDLEKYCLGKASDSMLVWVFPKLDYIGIRNEAGQVEDPLVIDRRVDPKREPHAVGMFNFFATGSSVAVVFDDLGASDEEKRSLIKEIVPGGTVRPLIGVQTTVTLPAGNPALVGGLYPGGSNYFKATFSVGVNPLSLTLSELRLQTVLPDMVTAWKLNFNQEPNPIASVDAETGEVTGRRSGNCQLELNVCIPGLTQSFDPFDFNGVTVLGDGPTYTPTYTGQPTPTRTPTSTSTGTSTRTATPTSTSAGATQTRTSTATATRTGTATRTATRTGTVTATSTRTATTSGPIIERLEPPYAKQGTAGLELRILGANFKPGAAVSFAPSDHITVVPPSPPDYGFVGPTELRQVIHIAPEAVVGERQVHVTNPGGASGGIRPYNLFAVTIADPGPCAGDCDRSDEVSGDEFSSGIGLIFDPGSMARCPQFDRDSNGRVTAAELTRSLLDRVQGCPAVTDCCTTHASPGCGSEDCALCVCTVDEYCCTGEWDEVCVETGTDFCSFFCSCGSGEPTPTPGGPTPTPTPVPSGSDCCYPHATAGCQSSSCEDCVCWDDPYCCFIDWDETCAEVAGLPVCAGPCGCPAP